MSIAVLSFVLRWIADSTCSSWSQTCRAGSDMLSHIYSVVFLFLMIVGSTKAKQITDKPACGGGGCTISCRWQQNSSLRSPLGKEHGGASRGGGG